MQFDFEPSQLEWDNWLETHNIALNFVFLSGIP